MEYTSSHFLSLCSSLSNFFVVGLGVLVLFAVIARHVPAIPEPDLPLKTPFGKLPFFDGIVLYGIVILILLGLTNIVLFQE